MKGLQDGATPGPTTPAPAAPDGAPRRTQVAVPHRSHVLHRSGYSYEKLDVPEFLSTPWIAPDAAKAARTRKEAIFGNGEAKLWKTSTDDLNVMGAGVTLYYRMLKYLSLAFALMSLVVVPSVFLCITGHKAERSDSINWVSTSIGNSGPPNVDSCVADDPRPACRTEPTVFVPLLGHIYAYKWVSLTIAGSDFLTCLIFLAVMFFISDRVTAVTQAVEGSNVKASDYAVLVRGLPEDVKEVDVIEHFHRLYDLGEEDWTFPGFACWIKRKMSKRGRSHTSVRAAARALSAQIHPEDEDPETSAPPTEHASESAEPVVPREKRYRFSVGDCLDTGPVMNATNSMNPAYLRKYVADVTLCRANDSLLELYQKQDKLRAKILVNRAIMKKYCGWSGSGQRTFDAAMKRLKELEKRVEDMNAKYGVMYSHKVEAAFVTFNCEESAARCVDDYADSDSFTGQVFQPTPLRFKNRFPLIVSRAPEPTEVLWENLHVRTQERRWRLFAVYCMLGVILAGSIAATLSIHIAADSLTTHVPSVAQCTKALPTIAFSSAIFPTDTILAYNASASCPHGQYGLRFWSPAEGFPDDWRTQTNDSVRTALGIPVGGTVPSPFGECINPHNTTTLAVPVTDPPETYPVSRVLDCFCLQELQHSVSLVTGLIALETKDGAMCRAFSAEFGVVQSVAAIVSFIVVFVNLVLTEALKRVTRFERHLSISDELQHLSFKLFLAQFINTAIMVQVVSAMAPSGSPSWLSTIMKGDAPLFGPEWYPDVGATLSTSMMLSIVADKLPAVVMHTLRGCLHKRAMAMAVSQRQLDRAIAPRAMEVAPHMAGALNVLFVTLSFSSALPMLLPLAAINFASMYWFDKFTLLRWHRKPPRMSNALTMLLVRLLPWALACHCIVAVWVYGDDSVLASPRMVFGDASFTKTIMSVLDSLAASKWDRLHVAPKLQRAVACPFAIFFAVLLCVWVVRSVVGRFVLAVLKKCVWLLSCGHSCGPGMSLTNGRPLFTGPYAVQLPPKSSSALSDTRARDGWQIVPDPTRAPGHYVELRVWPAEGKCNGVRHKRGQNMLTWQVIRQSSVSSYDILANPVYNVAAFAIKEAAEKWAQAQPMSPYTAQRARDDAAWENTILQDEIDHGIAEDDHAIPAHAYGMWAEGGGDGVTVSRVPTGAMLVNVDLREGAHLLVGEEEEEEEGHVTALPALRGAEAPMMLMDVGGSFMDDIPRTRSSRQSQVVVI